MKKDFQEWHNKKTKVDEVSHRPFFHEREIWWCILGINVGFEQDGGGEDFLRPVIIFRKFNNDIFWAIPLTHTKKDTKYYFSFKFIDSNNSVAILSQIRLVDARRLSHRFGEISSEDFLLLIKKFKALIP